MKRIMHLPGSPDWPWIEDQANLVSFSFSPEVDVFTLVSTVLRRSTGGRRRSLTS